MKGVCYMGRLLTGIAAGAIIGAAASIMIMPQMPYRQRRMINRAGKRMAHRAGDLVDTLVDYMR
jgi:gas vesicle protein